MDLFPHVFLIFNYWNFDLGIFVLRSSISVQMNKNIFGIINKRGIQMRKKVVQGKFIWHSRVPCNYSVPSGFEVFWKLNSLFRNFLTKQIEGKLKKLSTENKYYCATTILVRWQSSLYFFGRLPADMFKYYYHSLLQMQWSPKLIMIFYRNLRCRLSVSPNAIAPTIFYSLIKNLQPVSFNWNIDSHT